MTTHMSSPPSAYNKLTKITDKHLSLDSLRALSVFLAHVCYTHPLPNPRDHFDQWMDREQGFHQCCFLRMSKLPVGVRHLERLINQLTLVELHNLNHELDRGLARAIEDEEEQLRLLMHSFGLTCRDIRASWKECGYVETGAFAIGRETCQMLAEGNRCICNECWYA